MVHLVSHTVNPKLGLYSCWKNWHQISMDLREPPRKRLLQLDILKNLSFNKYFLS